MKRAGQSKKTGMRVGIVGATGMVGQELIHVLEKKRFPVGSLACFSSGAGRKSVRFRGRTLPAPAPTPAALESCGLVFFVSSDEVSLRFAPRLAKKGVWVIDDSAAFRLDPTVPLVIPEVNAHALKPGSKLIAGPNCTMAPIAVAGAPLHRAAGMTAVRIASYQAVSGAGKAALGEFYRHVRSQGRRLDAAGRADVLTPLPAVSLPRSIAFNVIPHVGSFDAAGHSGEELKVAAELRKVWSSRRLAVSVTAVRVPVIRGHALSAWFTTRRPLTPARARALLKKAPGLTLSPPSAYPTPLDAAGRDAVFAGRVRRGIGPNELALWIVADNLLKGAALNSVQIAEELLRRRWLEAR